MATQHQNCEEAATRQHAQGGSTDWTSSGHAETDLGLELAERLDRLAGAGRTEGLHGLVIMRHDQLIVERYSAGEDFRWSDPLGRVSHGPDVLHDLRSVTKSIVGLLYGIALAHGQVPTPKESLLRQFPEFPDLADDPARTRLTIEHVLTMTMGLEWNEDLPYTGTTNSENAMEHAPDRHRFALDRPVIGIPGERWIYSGGASTLLGRLIVKGTGQPLPQYARQMLFEPLDISTFEWITGTDGVASPASGLRLTVRSLAQLGQLVLGNGKWAGRHIVPAPWLQAALRPRVRVPGGNGYGYHWYLGTFRANGTTTNPVRWAAAMGNGGQRLFILHDLGLVIAMTAGNYDDPSQSTTPAAVLEEAILTAIKH
ncbi:serine hydrolase domain-containing protein [Fodinicola acaciae]|uniref:serine hydrolase domain-containing protein n=1 Tax=Fodinicola acaciae TaxID=2681555 RepID=UPI001C9E8B50|nr:serine hydrolase [Fodinicola acaciae]